MTIDLGVIGTVMLIGAGFGLGIFGGQRLNNRFGSAADNFVNNVTGGNSNVI